MKTELSLKTSETIKAMRFPLIVFVLFAHSTLWTHVAADPNAFSERAFKYVTDMFSFNIGRLPVAAFFLLSGMFFFWSLDLEKPKLQWFAGRWKKRVYSLLIPYLLWNALMVLAIFLKDGIFVKLGLDTAENATGLKGLTFIGTFWSGPLNLPLWYMRDLMCMSLLAPALYYIIRYFKWGSLAVLGIMYFVPVNYSVSGFCFRSVMFFSIGAWLGIYKYDPLALCRKVRVPSYIIASISLVISTFFTGTACHETILRSFWLFGIIAMFNLTADITENEKIKRWLIGMSKYVFFIYAVHSIYILGWTKGGLLRILGESMPAEYMRFFLIPVVVTIVCVVLYKILDKICPKALSFALGKR